MKKGFLRSIYGIGVILILWKALNLFYDSRLIPGPVDTFVYAATHLGELLYHAVYSLYRVLAALGMVLVIGVPLGIWIGLNKTCDSILSPIIYVLYPIPKVAFLAIIMIFFGLGDFSKIFLIFFILVFQVMLSVRDSVKGIEKEAFYSVYHLSLNRWQTLRHVVVPSVLPSLFTSLRISTATAFSVLFLAENFVTQAGIGYYIMDSWIMANYLRMFSGVLVISVLGALMFFAIDRTERKLCPYRFLETKA